MKMGMSATAHRRVTSVIGPIWPTANRPTIEWAPQTSVVITSSRMGLAQTDCMSPVLGAITSVMNLFGSFGVANGPLSALGRERARRSKRGLAASE
jgi:hypothetical protein